jgi:hypothetical protein
LVRSVHAAPQSWQSNDCLETNLATRSGSGLRASHTSFSELLRPQMGQSNNTVHPK